MEADVIFYQEVDERAARSCRVNEVIKIANDFITRYDSIYSTAYAYNLIVRYIPYPVPPIGDVRSGLMSLTGFRTDEAERIALPCPFNWPLRLTDYKKCLLLERLPLENSEKELVLINLHMDAFDSDDAEGVFFGVAFLLLSCGRCFLRFLTRSDAFFTLFTRRLKGSKR